VTDRARLIAVARGDEPPDLVIAGARVFSAFTREWLEADVAVAEGRIGRPGRIYPSPPR
jgi:adenine deaminase